jgi:alkyl sulfatase BDS1-like metallo-beta-lactamase superfamily hydrolase
VRRCATRWLDLFPDVEVAFASHHWPTWGKDGIRSFLANQRDTYRYIHDRALHLANQGQVMDEPGSETFMPKGLAADAASRGCYGTLSHNLRAVYNFYLGAELAPWRRGATPTCWVRRSCAARRKRWPSVPAGRTRCAA